MTRHLQSADLILTTTPTLTLDRLLALFAKSMRDDARADWIKPNEPRRKTGRDAETGEVYSEG